MGLWHTNGSPNLGPKTRPYNNQQQQKKKTCKIVDFSVPADHRIKLKECGNRDKYIDLAIELKKKTMEHDLAIELKKNYGTLYQLWLVRLAW